MESKVEPNWVRPAYLYLMSLIGVVVLAIGATGAAMGVVHLAAPRLKQTDTFSRLVNGVINVVEDFTGSSRDTKLPKEAKKALGTVRGEMDSQTRWSAANELLHGLILAGIGFLIMSFHIKRTELGAWYAKGGAAPPAPQT